MLTGMENNTGRVTMRCGGEQNVSGLYAPTRLGGCIVKTSFTDSSDESMVRQKAPLNISKE